MAKCCYHPIQASKNIQYPERFCNIIWGECQFMNACNLVTPNLYGYLCPIEQGYGYPAWFNWWISGQDLSRKVLVRIENGDPTEYTIAQLRNIITSQNVTQINIEYDSSPEPTDKDKLIQVALKAGYVTIYYSENNSNSEQLISVGAKAFKNLEYTIDASGNKIPFETINLANCLYIGAEAFYNCTKLTTVSFEGKSDSVIPVLDNINSFYTIENTLNTKVNIYVPAKLYNTWRVAPNWIALDSAGMLKTI